MDIPDIQYHMANASENLARRIFDKFGGMTIGPASCAPIQEDMCISDLPILTIIL